MLFILVELPKDIKSIIDIMDTSSSLDLLTQRLSVSANNPSSIWGSICKQVYLCNKPDKRQKLYLKWKNNSCNVQSIVKDTLNKRTSSVTATYSEEQFQVSYNLEKFNIQTRASLVTSTIMKDISKRETYVQIQFH